MPDNDAAQTGLPAEETALAVVEMLRPRWGDPQHTVELPSAAAALASDTARRPVDVDGIALVESRVDETIRAELAGVVGVEHVRSDHAARIRHTRGYSTPDLLRLRDGDADDAPDLVVLPGSHDEVVAVLGICAERRIAVVPFTGGTSVVGGLAPDRTGFTATITIDTSRLDGSIEIDEVSRLATLPAGLRGVRAEQLLAERGYTLGHFPQSYEGAGIGGYAAARSAGQSSAGYGRFDDMVERIIVATPQGTLDVGNAPKSAAGPDLRQLVLGSEGIFGVITSVTVRVKPAPEERVFDGWQFENFAAGSAAMRRLAQDGPLPTVLRLSDEVETALNLADPSSLGGSAGGCLMICGFEGRASEVGRRREAVDEVLREAGGTPLGIEPGEAWRRGRFAAPYLRDTLLDAGVLVETLETVTFWSSIDDLKAAVTSAITTALVEQGTPPLVMCHISHVYASGASLYFTIVCPQTDDPIAQWAAAKHAANEAIVSAGAAITHHHGIGRDHREAYHREIGPLALEALRAVKHVLDPAGICNPGILI